MIALIVLVALLSGPETGHPVKLVPPPGGATAALPCRFGLFLPRGKVKGRVPPVLSVGGGVAPGLEFVPVFRWSDGSVRWAAVRGCVHLPRGREKRLHVKFGAGAGRETVRAAPTLRLERAAGVIRVRHPVDADGRVLSLHCTEQGPGVPAAVYGKPGGWLAPGGGPHVVWRDSRGEETAAALQSVAATRSGRYETELAFVARAGAAAAVRGRLLIRAGTRVLEWEAGIEGWPEEGASAGVGLQMAAPLSAVVYRHGRTGRLRRRPARTVRFGVLPSGESRLFLDGRAVGEMTKRRGEREPSGPTGPMLVAVGHQGRWLALAASGFAERAGYAIQAAEDRVRIWLRTGGGTTPGRRERFRVAMAFCGEPPRTALWRAVRGTAVLGGAHARPSIRALDRSAGLGRWPCSEPGSGPRGAVYRRTLDLFLQELARAEHRARDDLGDYRVPELGFANHEYDAILALTRAFAWTGRVDALDWARCAVRHHLDVDADWQGGGLPKVHGPDHDGGVEPGHTWVEGLFAFGLLHGDAEAVEAAERTAVALAGFASASRDGFRRERDYAWTLRALSSAADLTGRADLGAARDRLAGELKRHVHQGGLVMIEPTRDRAVVRTTTFTALGVVAPALADYGRRQGDERAVALARRIARRYLAEAWDPEKESLAWTLHADLVAGRVIGTRGVVSAADLLFVAAGLATIGDDAEGGWCRRQAERLEQVGLGRFQRDGHGRDNGERVRALNALFELAARSR